jgi:hypothetical protein
MTGQLDMFSAWNAAASKPRETPPPEAPTRREGGAAHIAPDRDTITSHIAAALWNAGAEGLTRHELRDIVSQRRGRLTKETSLTQSIADLIESGHVRDSGRTRPGDTNVAITVYLHANARGQS